MHGVLMNTVDNCSLTIDNPEQDTVTKNVYNFAAAFHFDLIYNFVKLLSQTNKYYFGIFLHIGF